MDYKFLDSDDFLIIRLSGTPRVNERLLAREHLAPYLRLPCQRVILDLENINEIKNLHIAAGLLNTIQKEFQLVGTTVKLCSLKPELYRYIQVNRLDQIFDIGQSMEQAKQSFEGKSRED